MTEDIKKVETEETQKVTTETKDVNVTIDLGEYTKKLDTLQEQINKLVVAKEEGEAETVTDDKAEEPKTEVEAEAPAEEKPEAEAEVATEEKVVIKEKVDLTKGKVVVETPENTVENSLDNYEYTNSEFGNGMAVSRTQESLPSKFEWSPGVKYPWEIN